jgi:4-amino-4-deoxy-L-arabinose transferase-like glycosyltransferase
MDKIKRFYPLIIIALVGLALRLYKLTAISLWHDEAFSALLIRYSWGEMFHRIALDVHPPLYYILLRFWYYIFGDSLLSLRGFSVACGVAAIILGYCLVQRYFANRAAAIVSALFLATNFFLIQSVGSEARMYTLGVLLALAAAGSLMEALHSESGSKTERKWYIAFAVFSAAMLYTHYYLAFTVVAMGIYALGYLLKNNGLQWRRYLPFVGSAALTGILFLPWLKTFLFQLRQVQGGYWIPPLDRWSIPSTFWDITLGVHTAKVPNELLWVLITAFSMVLFASALRRIKFAEKWLVVMSILAPFAGAIAFYLISRLQGTDSSVFLVRYFAFAGVFYALALALWLETWRSRRAALIIVVAVVGINLFALANFWQTMDSAHKPGMAGASSYLNQYAQPGDKVIVASSFEFFNFKYYLSRYHNTVIVPKLYSGGQTTVESLPHYAGTALLTTADLEPDYKTAAKPEQTAWILWTNAFGAQPPIPRANWVKILEREYNDGRPYLGTTIYVTEYKVN